jgi:hypothetical protein
VSAIAPRIGGGKRAVVAVGIQDKLTRWIGRRFTPR